MSEFLRLEMMETTSTILITEIRDNGDAEDPGEDGGAVDDDKYDDYGDGYGEVTV